MNPEEQPTPHEQPSAADVPAADVPDLARLVAELGEAVRAHLARLGGQRP